MEKNRSLIFRIVGSCLVLGVAAAVLFGLTGVLRDPAVETATRVESAQAAAQQQKQEVPAVASQGATTADGGATSETVVMKDESEAFPQFDDEPSGS